MNQVYEDHKRLIYKWAWICHNKTGIEMEEFVSEFNVVFCEALTEYNPTSNTKFSTFLVISIKNRFKNLMITKHRQKRTGELINIDFCQISCHDPEESQIIYDLFVKSDNQVVRSIAGIVSTYKLPNTSIRSWLKKVLRSYGFKFDEIHQGFKELKSITTRR